MMPPTESPASNITNCRDESRITGVPAGSTWRNSSTLPAFGLTTTGWPTWLLAHVCLEALDGRVDPDYAGSRFRAAESEAVSTKDGRRVSITDTTGLQFTGPPEVVAQSLADLYARSAPEQFRTGASEPGKTDEPTADFWEQQRANARARQERHVVSEKNIKKLAQL